MGVTVLVGDCVEQMRTLPSGLAQTCITSPPYYGLRDYGHAGQIGLEETPDAYVSRLVDVFREVRRVLRDDGTLWLNLGDSYSATQTNNGGCSPKSTLWGGGGRSREGSKNEAAYKTGEARRRFDGVKPKDILGIPWMVAFALRADGWFLRADIIWHKLNPMPESVRDRPTKAHEYVFMLTKSARYFYDAAAIKEPASESSMAAYRAAITNPRDDKQYQHDTQSRMGKRSANRAWSDPETLKRLLEGRNARSVWSITTKPYSGAHFATMPPDLAERAINAGTKPGDTVLDPFGGAGTTGLVADRLGRHAVLCEINPEYAQLARERIHADAPLLGGIV
jgi:DNA modification methylase